RLVLATGGGFCSCLLFFLFFVVLLLLTFLPFPLFLIFPLTSFTFLITTCHLALHHLGQLGGCHLGTLGKTHGWCFGLLLWLALFDISEFLLPTFLLVLVTRYIIIFHLALHHLGQLPFAALDSWEVVALVCLVRLVAGAL